MRDSITSGMLSRASRCAVTTCVMLLTAATSAVGADRLLEKRESFYNSIFIFAGKDSVSMTFGQNKRYYTESTMKLSDRNALIIEYSRYMIMGLAYPPKVERILEIGLGGGRVVSYLNVSLPDTSILAVEALRAIEQKNEKWKEQTEAPK